MAVRMVSGGRLNGRPIFDRPKHTVKGGSRNRNFLSRNAFFAFVSSLAMVLIWMQSNRLRNRSALRSTAVQAPTSVQRLSEPNSGASPHTFRSPGVESTDNLIPGLKISPNSRASSDEARLAPLFRGQKSFEFHLCNGYANQLISLFHGAVVAAESGRTMVLPQVIMDGMQTSATNNLGSKSDMGSVGDLWDESYLMEALTNAGINVTDKAPVNPASQYEVNMNENLLETVKDKEGVMHLKLGCPLLRIDSSTAAKHAQLFFDLLAVDPNKRIMEMMKEEMKRIPNRDLGYNVLHLRIEKDWMRHCETWNGRHTWDCLGDYLHLGNTLRDTFMVNNSKPIFVITDPQTVDKQMQRLAELSLQTARFTIIHQGEAVQALPRVARDILYYNIALQAESFIGNNVCTISSLIIMHRRGLGRPAMHYNKGSMPIEGFLPFAQVPWVFAANGQSGETHTAMIKRSVQSLVNTRGTIKPYCLYQGRSDESLYKWLVEMGVVVMIHEPEWIDELWEAAERHRGNNNQLSHLYDNKLSIQSTFARIDMPLFKELSEYTYVLYTDNDVYLRGPIYLSALSRSLPKSVAMSYEMADMFPYNAGTMLANLPYLRETYQDFLYSIMQQDGDFNFPGYGPGDQGAYNSFYRDSVIFLDEKYNAKLYKAYRSDALIVHFHGPKPMQYMEQLRDGRCSFHTLERLCTDGLRGFCAYAVADHYLGHVQELQVSAEKYCRDRFRKRRYFGRRDGRGVSARLRLQKKGRKLQTYHMH